MEALFGTFSIFTLFGISINIIIGIQIIIGVLIGIHADMIGRGGFFWGALTAMFGIFAILTYAIIIAGDAYMMAKQTEELAKENKTDLDKQTEE